MIPPIKMNLLNSLDKITPELPKLAESPEGEELKPIN